MSRKPSDLDLGDWIIVAFLFGFAATGAVYTFKHPDPMAFTAWAGTLSASGGMFHWLRVRDSKQPDAGEVDDEPDSEVVRSDDTDVGDRARRTAGLERDWGAVP